MMVAYDQLAAVYDWLVADDMLSPEGSVATYDAVVAALPRGARVLDCAAGTGLLAVGLAERGFDVVASDASPAMIARTRALAAQRGVAVAAVVSAWDELDERVDGAFDAVLCVGNSLAHARGREGRRLALARMAARLDAGGLMAVTSRNWELLRRRRPALEVADRVVVRSRRRGLVVQAWTLPEGWDVAHHLDIVVALLEQDGTVQRLGERLTFWPFLHDQLDDDLRSAGLVRESSSWSPDVERYRVVARRAP